MARTCPMIARDLGLKLRTGSNTRGDKRVEHHLEKLGNLKPPSQISPNERLVLGVYFATRKKNGPSYVITIEKGKLVNCVPKK
jgi:hypothetical protein